MISQTETERLLEWAGWQKCACNDKECNLWFAPGSTPDQPELAPDITSLDVLHEMEKRLTIEHFAKYEVELCRAVDNSGTDSDIWFYVLTATAAQRLEALLLTLGLKDKTRE